MEAKQELFFNMNKNYLNVIYSPEARPFTSYPKSLIKHLMQKYKIKKGSKILDVCCGRGDFLNEFISAGLDGYGIDIEKECLDYFPKIKFNQLDVETSDFVYEDNYFDIVFNKSVIEHFYNPEKILKECFRVLKPGGIIITLTPSWKHNQVSFYNDFTHKQPFTKESLYDFHRIYGFNDVEVDYFVQLPSLWKNNLISKLVYLISLISRVFLPDLLKKKSKFIFFSKEIMLICKANKQ